MVARHLKISRRQLLKDWTRTAVGGSAAALLARSQHATQSFGPFFAKADAAGKVPKAPKPDKLSVVLYEPSEGKATTGAGKLFQQQYGVAVDVNQVPWANLHEKMVADLSAKAGAYDIIFIPGLWNLEFLNNGWVESLDKYWSNPDLPAFDIQDYPKKIVGQLVQNGHTYWIPHHGTTQILFYRKDLLAAEGLRPPETYDDLSRVAQRFTNNSKYPSVFGFGTTPKQGEWASSMWSTWLWSWGGDYFDTTWHPVFNNSLGVDSLNAFADATRRFSPPDALNWANEESTAAMAQGRLAILQMWPQSWSAFEDAAQSKVVGKVGYARVPRKMIRVPRLGSWGGTISPYSKHKEWAYTFLAFLNNRDNVLKFHLPAGVPVCRTSLTTDPAVLKENPWIAAQYFDDTRERPGIPEITQIIDIWGLAISQALAKQKTAKASLDDAAGKIADILRQGGYLKS